MHLCQGNCVAIGRRVVYKYARADHACSAGMKCRHCMLWLADKVTMIPFPIVSTNAYTYTSCGYKGSLAGVYHPRSRT